ncbi:hypothetical protein MLD38_038144 [Melastoma candidum]|uniref:Uncharacterized protein n=1 Tax=Melastoma candidum TaxID=119954 RepID=A0ACB9KY23_9MYRT|nr:hypothetical protein MLD38_038144 [Melastoma candidum]
MFSCYRFAGGVRGAASAQPGTAMHARRTFAFVFLPFVLDSSRKLSVVWGLGFGGMLVFICSDQVQVLLAELAMVEEEIVYLERKIEDMKLSLIRERKRTQECQMLQPDRRMLLHGRHRRQPDQSLHAVDYQEDSKGAERPLKSQESLRKSKKVGRQRGNSPGSASNGSQHFHVREENKFEEPNELSEQLIKCLISIFLESNRATEHDQEELSFAWSQTLNCASSKSQSTFKMTPKLDLFGILNLDATLRDIGKYRKFIQITRDTLNMVHLEDCSPNLGKLRVLMQKLGTVNLTYLTNKQKLAFWINIYNSCVMHAFLENGLPSSQEELLQLMNKAVLNVGGIVLNAQAIKHFILRHPGEEKIGSPMDEKEVLLRQAYGLGYPEPNVTFALCRGSWSSPALRVYTPEEVVNELVRAKAEYLVATVGVTMTGNDAKIVIPKLLQWHMRDFADDAGSLVGWIYSQLPRADVGGGKQQGNVSCIEGSGNPALRVRVPMPLGSLALKASSHIHMNRNNRHIGITITDVNLTDYIHKTF